MKRVIVNFKNLTPEIMSKLVEKYPDGYGDDDVITFKNAHNEIVEAVELRTEDCIYLVKVSTRLQDVMAEFDEDDYDESEFGEPIVDFPEKDKEEDVVLEEGAEDDEEEEEDE